MELSYFFFPSAVMIGAFHALEPGHAKTLTAAYLIGTKGTKRDAAVLGLSVAATHSAVVLGLSLIAVYLGRETFTAEAGHFLALGSSLAVVVLGGWLLSRRLPALRRARRAASKPRLIQVGSHQRPFSGQPHDHPAKHELHQEHDHSMLSDEEHARAHLADLPAYVHRGERPSMLQVMSFGAVGGLVPCPAAVSVMLLSVSISETGKGLILVLGFSAGLALTLVGIGLLVVSGITKLASGGRFSRLSTYAPVASAAMVIVSGLLGLVVAMSGH